MRRIRALVVSVLVFVLLMGAAGTMSAGSVYSTIARDHVKKSAWGRLSSWNGSTVSGGILGWTPLSRHGFLEFKVGPLSLA